MNDIKFFAKDGNEWKVTRNSVKCVNDGNGIDFESDKCEKLKLTERENCRNRFNRSRFYHKY